MKNIMFSFAFVSAMVIIGCSAVNNPCGAGQQECGDGTCAPSGNVCCGNGTSCPGGTICGTNNTCISSYVNNAEAQCESCTSRGLECCPNALTEQVDCMGGGRTCCFDGFSCPSGTSCLSNGQCS